MRTETAVRIARSDVDAGEIGPDYRLPDNRTGVTAVPPRRPRVLLVVCLYERNFGDLLIYLTIEDKLRKTGMETETVEVSRSLDETGLIARANSCDFLYFVGGGIIERWAPEIIARFDTVCHRLTVPFGVIGLSTGAFDYAWLAPSLKLFCDRAAFFYTRDSESVETFRRAGAVRLPLASADVVFANDALAGRKSRGAEITASFRNIPYPDVSGELDWERWGIALRSIGVSRLLADCSTAQQQLGLPVSSSNNLVDIGGSALIVAMRFHVILTAAMMGIPTIPVAYCPKVARLAEQLGLGDYCLGIHDHNRLEATASRLAADYTDVRETMSRRVASLRQVASTAIDASIRTIRQVCTADKPFVPANL